VAADALLLLVPAALVDAEVAPAFGLLLEHAATSAIAATTDP
jgi:hypothetical protein